MSRYLACTFLLSVAAPLPALAGDFAALTLGQDATPAIAAAATGTLRLIYLEEPPATPVTTPPALPRGAGLPPDRPVIVMAASCDWGDRAAGLGQTRSAFSASPVWLLEPGGTACDPKAIRDAFDAASAAPERERLAILLASGLRLSQAEAAPAASPAPAAAPGGLFSGQLIISSLPAGATLGGGTPLLIEATTPDTPGPDTPAPSAPTASSAPQPAVRANASGRAGLPEPAVVVGELASLLAADKRSATGAPREVRDRIREIDPAFFNTLLELGNFDPDEGQYVAAIQTELLGMNCYSGEVDGSWGTGSSSAAGRYFSELGAAQKAQTPGLALYREIATHPRVTCPAPVLTVRTEPTRAQPTATRNPRNTPRPGNGRNAPVGSGGGVGGRPAPQTAAQPEVKPRTPPKIDTSLATGPGGSGFIK